MAVASLFILHFGANIGYAIAPLEKLFFEAGLELAGGDPTLIHFAYPDYHLGRPVNLPPQLTNYITFDFRDSRPANIEYLSQHVRTNKVRLVVIFDIQVVDPLFRRLREAGVRSVIAYIGGLLSYRMPLWKLALKKMQVALSRSKVDSMIFESKAMADLAIYGRGVPRRMIDIVPLGVDTTVFKPERTDYVYRALELPREKKVVAYAGHMEPRKGVRVLVQAAMELLLRRNRQDVCFLLCGNIGDQSRQFEQMYAGTGIEPLIRFGGYRSDLARIYPGCFCGVIPSTGWDSFTYTSVEMAACGLPMIASRLQGLCEAVLDRKTGLLFEPGNASALADCIETLLDRPELAAEYGRQGRLRCERELNTRTHLQRFVSVLRKRMGMQSAAADE